MKFLFGTTAISFLSVCFYSSLFRSSCATSSQNVPSAPKSPGHPCPSGKAPSSRYGLNFHTDDPNVYSLSTASPVKTGVTLSYVQPSSSDAFANLKSILSFLPKDSDQNAQQRKFFLELLVEKKLMSYNEVCEANASNQTIVDKSIFDEKNFEKGNVFYNEYSQFQQSMQKDNLENLKEIFILLKIFGKSVIFNLLSDDSKCLSMKISVQNLAPESKTRFTISKCYARYSDLLDIIQILKCSAQFRISKIFDPSIGKYLIFMDFERLENFSFFQQYYSIIDERIILGILKSNEYNKISFVDFNGQFTITKNLQDESSQLKYFQLNSKDVASSMNLLCKDLKEIEGIETLEITAITNSYSEVIAKCINSLKDVPSFKRLIFYGPNDEYKIEFQDIPK